MFIENVSKGDLIIGSHVQTTEMDFLIQIHEPEAEFCQPKANFGSICRLRFMDTDDRMKLPGEVKISAEQADEILDFLNAAKQRCANVIVQCPTGIHRSGAVVELGIALGFKTVPGRFRNPNPSVRRALMLALERNK